MLLFEIGYVRSEVNVDYHDIRHTVRIIITVVCNSVNRIVSKPVHLLQMWVPGV